jgi:tetratricopeptide (TPR) repeat protein
MTIISPLGTCRIHTPLRRGSDRFGYKLDIMSNYGFVHTSAEIIQQLRFMEGDLDLPDNLLPLIARPNFTRTAKSTSGTSADLYGIEISSAKNLRLYGFDIQLNYTTRYFGDFFYNADRARRFWSMALPKNMDDRLHWLKTEPTFCALSPEDQQLLADIEMGFLDTDHIISDLQKIIDLVGKERVFVQTHIDAATSVGTRINSRSKLIKSLETITRKLDIPCFNPTSLMTEFGQKKAMENGGEDLTHYTPAFSDKIANMLYGKFIASVSSIHILGTDEPYKQNSFDLEHFESRLKDGDLMVMAREAFAALRTEPSQPAYQRMAGYILTEIGDFERALHYLKRIRSTEEDEIAIMRCYEGIGKPAHALKVGKTLLGDEHESPEILLICANSATAMGNPANALPYWKRLFQISNDQTQAATQVLNILRETKRIDEMLNWAHDVLKIIPGHLPCFAALWNFAHDQSDRQALLTLARNAEKLSIEARDVLAKETESWDEPYALALLAAAGADADDYVLKHIRTRHAAVWIAKGCAHLDKDELSEATELLQAAHLVAPDMPLIVRARRTLNQKFRITLRNAYADESFERVIALADAASNTQLYLTDLDRMKGMATVKIGNAEMAVTHLKRAVAESGPDASTLIYLARAANETNNFLEEIQACQQILNIHPCPSWAEEESRLRLIRGTVVAGRQLRKTLSHWDMEAGMVIARQLLAHPISAENAAGEIRRLYSALRREALTLDASDPELSEQVAEWILELRPDDQFALKAAAVSSMRASRFQKSREYWERLNRLHPNNPHFVRNMQKCLSSAERFQKESVQ